MTGIPHAHTEHVDGCFRCDLSRDEVFPYDDDAVDAISDAITPTTVVLADRVDVRGLLADLYREGLAVFPMDEYRVLATDAGPILAEAQGMADFWEGVAREHEALLWKVAGTSEESVIYDPDHDLTWVLVEGGQATLDAIADAIGYDEMGG